MYFFVKLDHKIGALSEKMCFCRKMAKYIFTQHFFNQNDSGCPEIDFRHNFQKCNILSPGPPPLVFFKNKGFPLLGKSSEKKVGNGIKSGV